jgi:hypothetical protein
MALCWGAQRHRLFQRRSPLNLVCCWALLETEWTPNRVRSGRVAWASHHEGAVGVEDARKFLSSAGSFCTKACCSGIPPPSLSRWLKKMKLKPGLHKSWGLSKTGQWQNSTFTWKGSEGEQRRNNLSLVGRNLNGPPDCPRCLDWDMVRRPDLQ